MYGSAALFERYWALGMGQYSTALYASPAR